MGRTWTERRISTGSTLKADDLNVEAAAVARQVNGGLDQHNAPMRAFGGNKCVNGTIVPGVTLSTYLAANSFHRSVLEGLDLNLANWEIHPESTEVGGGWQSLTDEFGQDGWLCEFVGRGGMVHGHAVVDSERRMSYVTINPGPVNPPTHDQSWLQIGVFVNGTLVADSGPIHPRRITVDLPFSCPCPTGEVAIEVKFRANTIFCVEDGYSAGGNTWTYVAPAERFPPIRFFASGLYARNQYK